MTNKFDQPSGAPPAYAPQSPPSAHLQSPAPSTDYYGASQHASPYPPNASPYPQHATSYGSPNGAYLQPQQEFYGPQGGGYPPQGGVPGQGGYYQQPPMGYGQPQYGQPYYGPQGQYVDDRRGGTEGLMGGLLAGLACCCCVDICLF